MAVRVLLFKDLLNSNEHLVIHGPLMADRVLFKDFLIVVNIHSLFDGRQGVIQGLFE